MKNVCVASKTFMVMECKLLTFQVIATNTNLGLFEKFMSLKLVKSF